VQIPIAAGVILMSRSVEMMDMVPVVPFLKLAASEEPWLVGTRCSHCGAIVPGERLACPSCGDRKAIAAIKLGRRGTLYNYTVVYRSFPGVRTPFVSAIVDLEGGGSLKGTLLEVDPDPAKLRRDMPIKIVFRDTGQKAKDGKSFLGYYFVPEGEA
jgi:scaffold protein (connect acetoacetyl-CoA thiolase and HMG-CoA synthase)